MSQGPDGPGGRIRRLVLGLLVLALAAVALAACDDKADTERLQGSGDVETHDFDLSGFNAIELASAFDAEITAGADYRIVVRVDDNLFEILEVELRGKTLHLGVEKGVTLRNATLEARITLPDLEAIDVRGASRAALFDFTSTIDRRIDVSGASRLEANLTARALRVDVSGASDVVLSGRVRDLDLDVSGASRVGARDLVARTGNVDASGASSVTVTITEEIRRLAASGASSIAYYGDAVVLEVSSSGASSVTPR